MPIIHATAIIGADVRLADSVYIGPYCVLDGAITLAEHVRLESNVCISGITSIGAHTRVFPFASLGSAPQDLKYKGESSRLAIGAHNTIREHVTMNTGTQGGGMLTQVGDHCLFMVGAHVAHDCIVGNHVILANNATLAGHVQVGDHAIIGGLAAVHQFVRIGKHAIVGGMSGVEHDVIPYGSVIGERAWLAGLNLVGLKRRNIDRDAIHALRHAYKALFHTDHGTVTKRRQQVEEQFAHVSLVQDILGFMDGKSSRSLCVPRAGQTTQEHE